MSKAFRKGGCLVDQKEASFCSGNLDAGTGPNAVGAHNLTAMVARIVSAVGALINAQMHGCATRIPRELSMNTVGASKHKQWMAAGAQHECCGSSHQECCRRALVHNMNAVGALMMNRWTMLEAVAYSLNKYAEMCDWESLPEEGYSPVSVVHVKPAACALHCMAACTAAAVQSSSKFMHGCGHALVYFRFALCDRSMWRYGAWLTCRVHHVLHCAAHGMAWHGVVWCGV
eukprot:scaffold66662_cov22-Tisochrysis_lutea.AAC.2